MSILNSILKWNFHEKKKKANFWTEIRLLLLKIIGLGAPVCRKIRIMVPSIMQLAFEHSEEPIFSSNLMEFLQAEILISLILLVIELLIFPVDHYAPSGIAFMSWLSSFKVHKKKHYNVSLGMYHCMCMQKLWNVYHTDIHQTMCKLGHSPHLVWIRNSPHYPFNIQL